MCTYQIATVPLKSLSDAIDLEVEAAVQGRCQELRVGQAVPSVPVRVLEDLRRLCLRQALLPQHRDELIRVHEAGAVL